jgi:hypothetical protein
VATGGYRSHTSGQPAAYEIDEPEGDLVSNWVPEVTSVGQCSWRFLRVKTDTAASAAEQLTRLSTLVTKIDPGGCLKLS